MDKPIISVIISTYNAEVWLEKVLWGYNFQTFRDFEIIIADDGSGKETKGLLDRIKKEVSYSIIHVWQEDDGFQKSKILNKALKKCSSDYIVMSDGDCIPRDDFLGVHDRYRKKGYFLSGGYFKLNMSISELISKDDIETGRCFDLQWLKQHGLKPSLKSNKLTSRRGIAKFMNMITPTGTTWNGHNSSGWKEDILAVNGFDERMQYGGQDRELGERLVNYGIKGRQIRYSAICIHLDHARGYKTSESIARNKAIRKYTRISKSVWTPFGIIKSE